MFLPDNHSSRNKVALRSATDIQIRTPFVVPALAGFSAILLNAVSGEALAAGIVGNKPTLAGIKEVKTSRFRCFRHFRVKAVLQTIVCIAILLCSANASSLFAQQVSTQISSRDAWVGAPIVLQIQIANAKDYTLPDLFEVDGCDVQAAGTPSQSSRITIINGRRSESRSVTIQYLITAQREGEFETPKLEVVVDGKTKAIKPISFVAKTSETGDLLFVEVAGKKEKVYVGQPLALTLKIWVKPFEDRKSKIKLKENHMWQMLSGATSWGAFTERLEELAENRQRPVGKTVTRTDENGNEQKYFLYELEATIYPNKPGEIDASDLKIVFNYPQALGRSRDPFDSLFEDRFGSSDLIRGMMGGGSPFGRRLTVSKSRPIVAKANVDTTEVLAVPIANQPNDYRGAVGTYRIVAQAENTKVSAGDPITLRIGIVGDGPMELIQAPPLHEIDSLTSDFQVTDQSLAGFVQDDAKVFVTSIRPKSESVKQIPPLPFSFFDPDQETFKTVYTEPIAIDVEKAESLALDAIVSDLSSDQISNDAKRPSSNSYLNNSEEFDLGIDTSNAVLQNEKRSTHWWWYFAIVPPLCWAGLALGKVLFVLPRILASMKSAKAQATTGIRDADDSAGLAHVFRNYIARLTKSDCPSHKHACGELREHGAYGLAAELESFFAKLNSGATMPGGESSKQLSQETKQQATQLLDAIERALQESRPKAAKVSPQNIRRSVNASIWIICLLSASTAIASDGISNQRSIENQQTILNQANTAFQNGRELLKSDPLKARQAFTTAANRYQLLVDDGVRNSKLFCNLASAWQQSGDETKAIVNYHRALWINPGSSIASQKLREIQRSRSADKVQESEQTHQTFEPAPNSMLDNLGALIGWHNTAIIFSIASVLFWLLLAVKLLRPRSKILRWCTVPLAILLVCGLAIYQHGQKTDDLAVIVVDAIELKSGDGIEFPTETKLESSSGMAVNIVDERADWRKVELPAGQTGWIPSIDLERIALQR